MELIQISPIGGDGTAAYKVELPEGFRLYDLFMHLPEKESGDIVINESETIQHQNGCVVFYSGENKKLLSVNASGGWGRMDYFVTTE